MVSGLRYSLRRLRSAPGFTAVAVLSLALGIGANTALFSIVNAALLRLIPVQHPEELVWFAIQQGNSSPQLNYVSYPFFEYLKNEQRFSGLLCAFPASANARHRDTIERVDVELISGSYFSTLGLRPYLGRLISSEDDRIRLGHPVVVVSHAYWQARLGSDPGIIGRALELNGTPYTIIGVSPPGFGGIQHGFPRSLFVPMHMKPALTPGWDGLDQPLIAWLWVVGRLAPGSDREVLARDLTAQLRAFQRPFVETDPRLTAAQRQIVISRRIFLEPLQDTALDERVRRHLRLLGWIVAGLLALTCTNLAGLLLARGLERQREFATRLAIGASRGRVMAQLLTESLLLALGGGALGLVLGGWLASTLALWFPLAGQGSRLDTSLDGTVLAFTVTISLITCVVFGLLPAFQSTKLDLIATLKGASQQPHRRNLRRVLLATQVAVAFVLLVLAGLFSVNLRRVKDLDVGFARQQLLLAELEPTLNGYSDEKRLILYRQIDERLREASETKSSGIEDGALSNVAPMSPFTWSSLFLIAGRQQHDKDIIPRAVAVGPQYFATMKIPLRRGRVLTARDDLSAPRVAVISESLARREFPASDPIGQHFTSDLRKPAESTFEIVGIVGDTELQDPRNRGDRDCVYLPYRQWPFTPQAIVLQLRLRSPKSTTAAVATIRRIIGELDPRLALYDIRTIETALDALLIAERLAVVLSNLFAGLAALLVCIGLYGVLAREVAVRTREVGIRLALGASRAAVLWALTRGTLLFVTCGTAAGVIAAIWLRPAIRPLMLETGVVDGPVIIAALAFVIVISTGAALLPARRATRIDPATALRWE